MMSAKLTPVKPPRPILRAALLGGSHVTGIRNPGRLRAGKLSRLKAGAKATIICRRSGLHFTVHLKRNASYKENT
jgi:hypothetical protein